MTTQRHGLPKPTWRACYNAATGLVEGNNLFQVATLHRSGSGPQRWKAVKALTAGRHKRSRTPSFSKGDEPASTDSCPALLALLNAPDWPSDDKTVPAG